MVDLDALNPQPLKFGICEACPYVQAGSVAVCYACASRGLEQVPDQHCAICSQALPATGTCSNSLCHRSDRAFEWIRAISMRSGALKTALDRYKYERRTGWAGIFGRVLVGYLDEHAQLFEPFDLIVPSPTFVGPGSHRDWDHIRLILDRADVEAGGRWPFNLETPAMITKTADTPEMMGRKLTQRRQVAENDLRNALHVPDPALVQDTRILIFDDVFTGGNTLQEVALKLRAAGASSVCQVVLARQPWTW